MDCERIRDLLPAYVLGSLSAAEQAAVAQHLATCPDCRRLADELAATAATLPRALAASSTLRPPDAVKDRLLRSLEAAPVGPAVAGAAQQRPEDDVRPVARPTELEVVPANIGRPAWLGGDRWQVAGRIAAVLILALSLIWSVRLTFALGDERALRVEYADLLGQIVSQQEIVFEVIDSDQSVRRILRSQQEGSTAYGKLFTRTDLPHVVAMAARLPAPPPGETFHLWLTMGNATTLAGELTTDEHGFGMLVFDAPEDGPAYDAAALTLQPSGGTSPSGPLIIAWEADGS